MMATTAIPRSANLYLRERLNALSLFIILMRELCSFIQCEIEGSALVDRRFRPDASAMSVHDALRERQSRAVALKVLLRMKALENAEQFVRIFHIKTDAIVDR